VAASVAAAVVAAVVASDLKPARSHPFTRNSKIEVGNRGADV